MTYNIHRGIGNDGLHSPGRIQAVLGEINADVIALQEIELHRDPALDLLNYFADDYGLTAIPGPTIFKSDAHYGNALLTRLKIEDIRRIDLTVPGHEPRGALDIDLACDQRRIHVVATHLGLYPGERRRQVRKLLSLFERRQQSDFTVFMGDINEWFLWGRPLRWLKQQFPAALTRRTFPARLPLFALDRIWVRPASSLASLDTHNSSLARLASDHLPLTAVISIP